ncbi:MAG: purine-binding chemotaxis protein CheW [Candidatus Delongbacteria bacterium]|nr:purine-binding chemotaxis protein CheW [Candidatus Delongbacteria bacterium]
MSVDTITNNTQYLTFKLSNEIYALEIDKVREVLDMTVISKVPQTPDFMLGVINLRGSVVPVVDMRLKFGLDKGQKTVNTCIIIMEVTIDQETTILGALVDSVQEVLDLEPSQLEPPPRIGTRLKIEFIKAMGKWKKQFIIILDIDRIFSMEELSILQDIDE